jgi:hypothetical protein
MDEMASMPSIRRQSLWRFLMCPKCGKVEKEYGEAKPPPGTANT